MNKTNNNKTLLCVTENDIIWIKESEEVCLNIYNILLSRTSIPKYQKFSKRQSYYNLKWKNPVRFKNLSNTNQIELIFINSDNIATTLQLPDEMKNKISEYLKNRNQILCDKDWFDCYSFVKYITWKDKIFRDEKNLEKEDLYKMQAWTVVLSYDRVENDLMKNLHFFILLWQWLALSKIWNHHDIVVTSIEELSNIYSFNNLHMVKK